MEKFRQTPEEYRDSTITVSSNYLNKLRTNKKVLLHIQHVISQSDFNGSAMQFLTSFTRM